MQAPFAIMPVVALACELSRPCAQFEDRRFLGCALYHVGVKFASRGHKMGFLGGGECYNIAESAQGGGLGLQVKSPRYYTAMTIKNGSRRDGGKRLLGW